ncbi:alpha/beta-hydrolase [Rhizoclosmatium globosum]|uniref:Alpha/beta-hydrolase n=1 Tax=Rhizoclosmatium globosum TaxID=329046 RepID=A0A1Y2CPD5_9FUNG|nr:alpha/beta-hydrolase [Rhizoclosmatium globosum]|eukprot:ORY48909.1 alpha/beta-hydrolase [Rhizoclosmatium globosum]
MTSIACCGGSEDTALLANLIGNEESIANTPCYVAYPKQQISPSTCVVIGSDVFGYKLINTRAIADKFASEGHLAVIPDLFGGTEPPSNLMVSIDNLFNNKCSVFAKIYAFSRFMWYLPLFFYRNRRTTGAITIDRVIAELRAKRGIKKVAFQGYCWGGAIAVILAKNPNSGIDVACSADPGVIKLPEDVQQIVKPIYFVLAGEDITIKEHHRKIIEETLSGKDKSLSDGFFYKVDWFKGATHGFAVRGKESDPVVSNMRQEAFQNALSFFTTVFNKLS